MAIIGGAKVSTKIAVLSNLLEQGRSLADRRGMANTFFKAQGGVGKSLVEDDKLEVARQLLEQGDEKLLLPVDAVVAAGADGQGETAVVRWRPFPRTG